MPSFDDYMNFKQDEYKIKVHQKNFTYGELAKAIYIKRRKIMSSRIGISIGATGILAAHVVAIATILFACRTFAIETRKLEVLEAMWSCTGESPLPTRPWRDVIIPVTIGAATNAFTFDIDLSISNAVSNQAYGYSLPISQHIISAPLEHGMEWMGEHVNEQWDNLGRHYENERISGRG